MLTIYRSNRAEWLARVLAEQLRLAPPGLFDSVDVVVNTWPTSRWLGEQLASVNGISALVRFPFPGSRLRQLVRMILGIDSDAEDPWRASRLVWPLLDLLPQLLETEEAAPLREWVNRQPSRSGHLNRVQWQLARSIADAFDDYALYRPQLIHQWLEGSDRLLTSSEEMPLTLRWQPLLLRLLAERLNVEPFGIQVHRAVSKLRSGDNPAMALPSQLRLFGLSSLAPVQVELIQALSGLVDVQMFLLTPCPDLWQRCRSRRETLGYQWTEPADGFWLLEAPRLEAILGRMGAEFQQLLEGGGESQLGQWQEGDLFAAPATMACESGQEPTLLEQLQQQLVSPEDHQPLRRRQEDSSLQFLACPGQWRQVQLVRDQILQWFAADPSLEPRDVLVMTPQVNRFAPLLASVFNDAAATGVELPWRLTDRSQQDSPGLTQGMLQLLQIAGERLTATALEGLLANPAIQQQQGFSQDDASSLSRCLQRTGFRWGLDAEERGGDETHSLSWCLDRWLLGLVLPSAPGLAPGGAAPFAEGLEPAQLAKWWQLLAQFCRQLKEFRRARTCGAWVELLQGFVEELFGDGGSWAWERQCLLIALEDWRQIGADCTLLLEAAVVADVLNEALSADSGRFGHRTGALTVSALEPMRAIPHRVIVLMGLDADVFPRHRERAGFHLLEQQRQLGDPRSSDQDRYVLLEALMSTRQHLLITWNSRDEHTGECRPAASPVQQWLGRLQHELSDETFHGLCREPAANPLERSNFLSQGSQPPPSCDRRHFEARRWLDKTLAPPPLALALPLHWSSVSLEASAVISSELLLRWLIAPQLIWLEQFQVTPREWFDPVEDLEALDLDEWHRHGLLKQRLSELLGHLPTDENGLLQESEAGDWKHRYAGQATLPPGAAATLECERLEQRWQHLQATLLSMGPCSTRRLELADGSRQMLWAGDTVVVVQPGQLKSRGVMEGWLSHLQVCANHTLTSATVVVARCGSAAKKDQFEIALRWQPLPAEQAREQLIDLQALACQGLSQCWPVPPMSGWAYANANNKSAGRGEQAFRQSWSGGFHVQGERERAEMQLCFGVNCEASELLNSAGFEQACTSLYGPLVEALAI
ncbi:exodeoxyribonuclease V subunit gamma [Prochlorococcus sp. MIT 1306]|uniref:exodeoxyribonuclease V subunit gamma n=1 Tax=Prochlorococcus sp. MIT 1306 TaxID=1799667 RepID=UPI0007B323AB|nr:exodeoxyribonuclease V subunit gamma [Prochlorococcus sp. MIT 1306]KZR62835.1 RecBCD enzyme subunit RecC [Prochlorococcus sp. MIT 1306]